MLAAAVELSGATFTIGPNAAVSFLPLEDAKARAARGREAVVIAADLRQAVADIKEGKVLLIPPPPVWGIGRGCGYKMYVQDQGGAGMEALNQVAESMVAQANQQPGLLTGDLELSHERSADLRRCRSHEGANAGHPDEQRI